VHLGEHVDVGLTELALGELAGDAFAIDLRRDGAALLQARLVHDDGVRHAGGEEVRGVERRRLGRWRRAGEKRGKRSEHAGTLETSDHGFLPDGGAPFATVA
jgi:hypothetical protein